MPIEDEYTNFSFWNQNSSMSKITLFSYFMIMIAHTLIAFLVCINRHNWSGFLVEKLNQVELNIRL